MAGEWLALPEDFSISLEQNSPLFNDQGTFSFPFEIPLEPNRHVFRNVADPFGDITLADIDRMEAEVWFDGVMLYRGVIETDEKIEFEDSLPVTFLSGNSDFMDRIEGMNARDVPLDREIKVGYRVGYASAVARINDSDTVVRVFLPSDDFMRFTEANVSDPYPLRPYCNVRICAQDENGKYVTLEYDRNSSGVCFYVLYLIDCLLRHLEISAGRNDLEDVEDMCRLAFFTTRCDVAEKGDYKAIAFADMLRTAGGTLGLEFEYSNSEGPGWGRFTLRENDFTYYAKDVYATSQNYPDIGVEDVLEDLKNAFGARFLYDARSNSMSVVLVKNVLADPEERELSAEILSAVLTRQKPKATVLSYGNDDDTAFNYSDWSNVEEKDGYLEILREGVSSYNTTCYVDRTTGNAYRIKVNNETGGDPSLFEVGGYRDYVAGDSGAEEKEEVSIGFSPVAVNDVNGSNVLQQAQGADAKSAPQVFAVFADVQLKSETRIERDDLSAMLQPFMPILGGGVSRTTLLYSSKENYDRSTEERSPLRDYDAGYCLGIMRGPGNKSGVEYVRYNYDGEGNDTWTQVVADYAFTADSCDNFGRFFDYNGTEEGGADQSGRFSLKLVAGKDGYPVGERYADRGLAGKFLSEYLYFMSHKRTVTLTVRTGITRIVGIDFLKRYRIGEYVGFVNKVSYTLTVRGMEDVQIELFTL